MKKTICFAILAFVVFSCKSPEARRPVSQKTGSYINESAKRNKKLVAQEEKAIQEIIKEDSLRTYISSPNGFWYYYEEIDSTTTQTPEFGNVVEFDYNIKTLDGKTIYPREERTYTMDQEELFGGLREGLKLMRQGETVTFIFPSHKAFGFYGDKNQIGTNVPIKSTVTLKKITENK